MDGLLGLGFGAFGIVFAIVGGFVVLTFVAITVLIIVIAVRNAQKARQLGHDPLTMETELAAKAIDSTALAPARTLEQRLAELADLHARGVITDDEYRTGRERAIEQG